MPTQSNKPALKLKSQLRLFNEIKNGISSSGIGGIMTLPQELGKVHLLAAPINTFLKRNIQQHNTERERVENFGVEQRNRK